MGRPRSCLLSSLWLASLATGLMACADAPVSPSDAKVKSVVYYDTAKTLLGADPAASAAFVRHAQEA